MYTTHPHSTPIPLLTANNTTLPRRHQCAHFNPTSPSLTTMRCTRPVIHITLQARLRRCMTAAASAGRAPIEPHRCILRVTNCCRVGNLPAYLPACSLQPDLCVGVHIVGISTIITLSSFIHHRTATPRFRSRHLALPLTRADVRRRHASIGCRLHLRQMYKYICGITVQNCRTIYLRCAVCMCSDQATYQTIIVAEDLFTCLPEQQPIYTCISA
jgi:hypothetical protein